MSFKKIALVFLSIFVYGIVIFLVYLWVNKTPDATQNMSELEANQQKWQSKSITHYRFSLKISCICEFAPRLPFLVEVKDGKAVSVIDNRGDNVSMNSGGFSFYEDLLTVNGLFDQASNAISKADEFNIEYNPDFGYPSSIGIDWHQQTIDDEMSITVTDLEPLP